jgi:L-glyceraldehyde 3-phosphate reductase
MEETMGALDAAVRQGKALYVGISSYSAEQTRTAAGILRDLGTPCLIHQPVYNMLNRWVEDRLLDVLEEEGIGCIAFSPLAQGLLTDRYLKGIPQGARATKTERVWLTEKDVNASITKVRRLDALAHRCGRSLAQMAIAWVLRKRQVTSALVGASSVKQLEDTIAALSHPELGEDVLREIEAILAS